MSIFSKISEYIIGENDLVDESKRKFIKIVASTSAATLVLPVLSTLDTAGLAFAEEIPLRITGLADPSPAADQATKSQIDALSHGMHARPAVKSIEELLALPHELKYTGRRNEVVWDYTKQDALVVYVEDLNSIYLRNPSTLEWVSFSHSRSL